MGRKYKIRNQESFYFVTFTIVNWVDIFTREEYRNIFIDSVKYCQANKGLLVGAWCIMTNHVHMIIGKDGSKELQDIIRDLKSFTSRHIRKYMEHNPTESRRVWIMEMLTQAGIEKVNNIDWQMWLQHNHPIELTSNFMIDQKIEYIHNNPVVAGFVDHANEWRYSSARDYQDQKGLIDIYYLD